MVNLELTGTFEVVTGYSGKSKFDLWMTLKPGDTLKVSVPIKTTSKGNRGNYAVTLQLEANGHTLPATMNEMVRYLKKIELKQI